MTTHDALILAGIVLAFVLFGVSLAWADFYSRAARKAEAKELPAAHKNASDWNDERRAA